MTINEQLIHLGVGTPTRDIFYNEWSLKQRDLFELVIQGLNLTLDEYFVLSESKEVQNDR